MVVCCPTSGSVPSGRSAGPLEDSASFANSADRFANNFASDTGGGKLRLKTEYEQELWSECSRLIANCIIFYNACILSRLLEHQERIGDTQGAEATKTVSPIVWQNINLQGRFEFLKQPDALNVDAIIRALVGLSSNQAAALVA